MIDLWAPHAGLSLEAAMMTAFLLGIVHGITPDEHTWPITFSYAVGSYSTRKGLLAGLIFSLAFTVQRALASELAYLALDHWFTASAALNYVVYIVVGVNGVGKTTTIAKMTAMLRRQGRSVILAAGDTFRAAAIEQIEIWGKRVGVDVVKHREGSDPSAVIFDAIRAARARGIDTVIADTAGRLHTKSHLMEELKKIDRVLQRELGRPADETLLVLDATTGQNGISQARSFKEAVPLTGLVLAKLDGTARGGIVISIVDDLGLPIKLVGTGEKADDIEPFDANAFVEALLR